MKNKYKEFLTLLANVFLIVCFALSSYLILINYFHSKEINLKYTYNASQKSEHQNFKNSLTNIENNINSINTNNNYLESINNQFKRCIIKIKESDYYNLNNYEIGLENIYKYNSFMYKTLQSECLYLINLKIKDEKTNNSIKNSYFLEDEVLNKRKDIIFTSNYLSEKLSANNSYYYTSELTKTTIFNDIKYSMDLTINNYSRLIIELNKLSNWYLEQTTKVGDN